VPDLRADHGVRDVGAARPYGGPQHAGRQRRTSSPAGRRAGRGARGRGALGDRRAHRGQGGGGDRRARGTRRARRVRRSRRAHRNTSPSRRAAAGEST
jgi:hypothetical protein